MPQITDQDGRTQVIPGVYLSTAIISSLPGPLPAFQIPVIMGSADYGRPYDYDTAKQSWEALKGAFVVAGTASAVGAAFGPGSGVHKFMQFAQRHGLPFSYVVSLSKLTRAGVLAASIGPVLELEIYPRDWGAIKGHIKIQHASATSFKVTPIKQYTPLVTNAGATDTRLIVRDNSWIQVGTTYSIGDNTTANVLRKVLAKGSTITADGRTEYYVDLTAVIGGALTTALYAMFVEYDANNVEDFTVTDTQDIIDQVNADSKELVIAQHANFSAAVLISIPTATAIKDMTLWGAVTVGTSPVATATDVTAWVAQMNTGAWEDFAIREQLLPQAYALVMPESAAHIVMRDYAIAERTRGFAISVTTGCEWADIDLASATDTNPTVRTAALNAQEFALCAGGMDEEPAYISLAGAVFGRRIGGGVNHNLTQDGLIFSTLEVRWDEISGLELTRLHRAGVITYRMAHYTPFPFVISQGLSTLQNNSGLIWNEVTKETWSLQQRDLADFIDRVLKEDLNSSQLGADGVSPNSIAAVLVRRAKVSLEKRGYIVPGSHKIISITQNAGASGYDVNQCYKLAPLTDYITVKSTIVIGD